PPTLGIYPTPRGKPTADPWLDALPRQVEAARARWDLTLLPPYHGGSCSWVAPARRADGPGAVLKLCWPHREAAGEATARGADAGRGAAVLAEFVERAAAAAGCAGVAGGGGGRVGRRARSTRSRWSATRPTIRGRCSSRSTTRSGGRTRGRCSGAAPG